MTAPGIELRLYAELNDFLPPQDRQDALWRPVRPHQTVKDIVEAAGVPHTEIDLLLVNGESVGFEHHPRPGDRLAAYPMFESLDISGLTRVRPHPLREPRMLVDVNLGGLARLLRLMGQDVRCDFDATDARLAEISDEIVHELSPGTRENYDTFRRCTGCGRIYWAGAHQRRLDDLVTQILAAVRR